MRGKKLFLSLSLPHPFPPFLSRPSVLYPRGVGPMDRERDFAACFLPAFAAAGEMSAADGAPRPAASSGLRPQKPAVRTTLSGQFLLFGYVYVRATRVCLSFRV